MQLLLTHKRQALLLLALALLLVDVFLLGPSVWLAASLLRPSVLHSDLLSAVFLLLRNALLYAAEGSFAALVLFSWRLPWRALGMRLPSDPRETVVLLLGALLAIVAILLTGVLWRALFWRVFHVLPESDDQWTFYRGPASHAAQVVLLLGGAPLCEEIIFRGLMQGWALRVGITPPMAIVGTALLFAAGHLDPSNLESYFLSGLVLGYLAYRTRSLLPGMIWHALFNLLALLGLLLH